MNVFLVPVAPDRYELYCEHHDEPAPAVASSNGLLRRAVRAFQATIAAAEDERRREPDPAGARPSWLVRLKRRLLRWVAESIAEQRLLWQLRGRAAATLVHPDDLSETQATQLLRRSLQRDWERHRFWMIVDALGGVASLLLILVPGPNIIGYYFLFRIVGHFLSLRGARQGLLRTTWTGTPSAVLTRLRALTGEPPDRRETAVREVADALGLDNFTRFFQRAATS
jgi:hypothetical protein